MTGAGSDALPVRRALRDATEAVHLRLHGAPPFRAIAEGRLGRCGYAELLGRMHGFHLQIEQACAGTAAALLPSRRIALLEADLASLGASPVPPPDWSSPPESDAAALGALYVAQGSIMGGKIIYRQLDYLFGRASAGRSYFRGSRDDGQRWRMLCLRIERDGAAPDALDQMIAAARSTFANFERCIADALPA